MRGDKYMDISNHSQQQDILEDQQLFELRLDDIRRRVQRLDFSQNRYIEFCEENDLTLDKTGVKVSDTIQTLISETIQEFELDYSTFDHASNDVRAYSRYITRQNFRIRNLLLLLRQCCAHLEWSSGSYSQAVVPSFLDVRKQTGQIVNYDRWESFMIQDLERELAKDIYALEDDWSLLLTSSGMAAYATLHHYLTTYLSPGDNILIPVPVYHEAQVLISAVNGIEIRNLGTTDISEIIQAIDSKTRALFLTPITNNEPLNFLDIEALIRGIHQLDQEIYLIVDGTMSGGLTHPERYISATSKIELLYFESGNKYQQFEDTGMKGIVIIPQRLKTEMALVRQRLGTILYDQVAVGLPQAISHDEMKRKLERFSRNALLLSNCVNADPRLQGFCTINYPGNESHRNFPVARQYPLMTLGGVVTFSFDSTSFYNLERLEGVINTLIQFCQQDGIPFCKGDSYGFSIPRIHIGDSKTDHPFLRLCVGNRSIDECNAFINCVVNCLIEHRKAYG